MGQQINRLVWHHAASTYKPSKEALAHYHAMIDGDGQVIYGDHDVLDNATGKRLVEGQYAAHTWKLNTGAAGVSILAMDRALWADPFGGNYPVKPVQVDALIKLSATYVRRFGIVVGRETTLSHAEVQPTLHVTQKNKWDFDYDPRGRSKSRDPVAIGDELRQELRLVLGDRPAVPPPEPQWVTLSQGDYGEAVAIVQRLLGIKPDGQYGPKTVNAVIAFQKKHQLRPDGKVGPMTWAMLEAK